MKTNNGIDLKKFEKWILKNVGKRCDCYCVGCYVCDCWHCFDALKSIIEEENKEL